MINLKGSNILFNNRGFKYLLNERCRIDDKTINVWGEK